MPKQRKDKKIHKNKTNSPHPKQTQNKPQSGNDLKQQQFSHQQGIFQQLANIDENDGNSQRAQNVNQQEINKNNTKIQGYSISNGFLYTLDIGLCYRIINVGQSKEKIKDICVVDGMVDVNGKLYRERFGIKDNNSLIILAKKGQQAKDNSKRIVEQHTKIPKKVKNQRKLNKNIRQVVQKLKTSAILSQQQSVISEQLQFYLHNYQSHENILLFSNHNLTIYKLNTKNKPWQNINPHEYINKGQTTLVIGLKNTGKSMLCDYLLNWADRQDKQLCILDLDIGRNRVYPGTVSLEILDNSQPNKNEVLSIWVGEYTPVNSIPVYIKAINQLYNYYKQKHFTKSLIVNTMGYLTGVGQLIIYQIFNVLKPQKMLIIQNNSGQQDWATQNIRKNIQSGNYTERLYFKVNEQSAKSSTRILKYKNQFAQQKAASDRFQSLLSVNAISSLDSLLIQIYSRRLRKLNKNIQIYRNSKQGNINQVQYFTKTHTEMRIIVLGQFWRNGLVNVRGIGFGWDGGIYYNQHILQEQQIEIGIISDGLDFDRSFYSINQAKMIQIQNMLGIRLPYICSIFKVLGNKGMRNNSSKKSNSKQAQFN